MAVALALVGCASTRDASPATDYLEGFIAAERQATAFVPVTAAVPGIEMDGAYDLQWRLVARRVAGGDRVAGYKGGLMSAKSLADRGVSQPLTGVLFASGDSAGAFTLCGYRAPIFELKLGYVFRAAVTRPLASTAELRKLVGAIQPVIEIPDIAYRDPNAYGAIDMVAANISSARYVRGAASLVGGIDPDTLGVRLERDGAVLARGTGRESLGDQWESLRTVVNLVLARGGSIAPGQLVLTGKIGDKGPVVSGAYVADYGALGTVRFNILPCP
jgi:2-keto-4-pentenoate hydratase